MLHLLHPYITAVAVVAAVYFFARCMAMRSTIKSVRAYKADRIYWFETKIAEQKNIDSILRRVGKEGEHMLDIERNYMRQLQSKLELAQTIPI
jgi:hypothetical protein